MTHTYPPIDRDDIKKGDRIRNEWLNDSAYEFIAAFDGDNLGAKPVLVGRSTFLAGASAHFLIDRPAPIVHAKGTTLWFADTVIGKLRGLEAIVTEDFHTGDTHVHVKVESIGRKDGWIPECFSTTPPAPAVEIPETPTLGTVTFDLGSVRKGVWWRNDGRLSGATLGGYFSDSWTLANVTVFTPLHVLADDETAVKTAAVEVLRGANIWAQLNASPVAKNIARLDAILTFLATIDSADESS